MARSPRSDHARDGVVARLPRARRRPQPKKVFTAASSAEWGRRQPRLRGMELTRTVRHQWRERWRLWQQCFQSVVTLWWSSSTKVGSCSMRGRREVRYQPPIGGRTIMDRAHRGGERTAMMAPILTAPVALRRRGWTDGMGKRWRVT
jgi:hypothetical protein